MESWFAEIGAAAGLDFVHDSNPTGQFFTPEIIGSGAALFDYDLDGDIDAYLVQSGGDFEASSQAGASDRLFRQGDDGRFSDSTAEAGLQSDAYGMGATVGDIDNDGDLDLFVSNFGPDRLYRNNGDGTFTDITQTAGLSGNRWSTSAVFFDFNLDGRLDLYVTTYVHFGKPKSCTDGAGRIEYCGPKAFDGEPDMLYRNDGDGKFTDVSENSGIGGVTGKGLGVVATDFNSDGYPDVLVANDGEKNTLWINQGNGRFEDQALVMGTAFNIFGKPEASMGIAVGDVNGDLLVDVLLTHLTHETNTLYTTTDSAGLLDTTARSGLGASSLPYTGFGTAFFDVDHDGDLDLIVVNGRVSRSSQRGRGPQIAAPQPAANTARVSLDDYAEPDLFFLNDGSGKFENACPLTADLCDRRAVSRGLAVADIDDDGDLDFLVTDSNGPVRLYRNQAPAERHWLKVRVLDPRYDRDAIGARVYVTAGGRTQMRPVTHTYSYLSSSDATVHFGLAGASEVDEIFVRWLDGSVESFAGQPADQTLTLALGEGHVARAIANP